MDWYKTFREQIYLI